MLLALCYIVVFLIYWSVKWMIGEARFIWFDLWVGIFVDVQKKRTYFCPLPCFVIWYDF